MHAHWKGISSHNKNLQLYRIAAEKIAFPPTVTNLLTNGLVNQLTD